MCGASVGLQREIRLDRAAQVERAAMEQRPAAVFALVAPDEGGKAGFDLRIDFVQEMLEQDMLGRDRGIRFQRKYPMAVRALELSK
jgi:hypothetical protein